MDKEKRINELIDIINDLNYHYYTLDKPKVSDKDYDLLYDELVKLEKETKIIHPYSPTQRVGGSILERFEKHTHLGRLWSLDK
ncbi:MAG TPA: NAD-dependent DNA ligase LigA, partial [Tissierellaceae bacterium]